MKQFTHTKSAFTMLELVFVIVVLGILAAIAMPRLDRDLKQEAADNILSDIRYVQHLALMDDKHRFDDPNWQKSFWKIMFGTCSTGTDKFYMLGSDDDMDGGASGFFDQDESAIDPTNGKSMFWVNGTDCNDGGDNTVSDRIFLTHKFGIKDISTSGGCANNQYLGFDHYGRPHNGFTGSTSPNSASYMSTACTFTFTMSDDDTFDITIEPETGFAYIVGQESS